MSFKNLYLEGDSFEFGEAELSTDISSLLKLLWDFVWFLRVLLQINQIISANTITTTTTAAMIIPMMRPTGADNSGSGGLEPVVFVVVCFKCKVLSFENS